MHLFNRFRSLRRRSHKTKARSRQSSGSSFEYGQPSVDRFSGDFDPYQYRSQATDHPNFGRIHSAGIPIRSISPHSFPPLEHAIDYVPRRDPNELASTPSVKVHRKKLLQRTEFPHGDAPHSPRKVSRAKGSLSKHGHGGHDRSIYRVESVYSSSSDEFLANSPRLDNLRRDPSVLSLVAIMNPDGCIPSDVFTNSPETYPLTQRPIHYSFSKSAPDLSIRTSPRVDSIGHSRRESFNLRINAAPDTPSVRPRSEFLVPSFPRHILSSRNCCVTPESHSFSSLQGEQGSFSIAGDSTQGPPLITHKSHAKASDAFRFLEDRYTKDLPPTLAVPGPRGHSANGAVGESSLAAKQIVTSREPRIPFVHERGGQTLPLINATYNVPSEGEPVCFLPVANTSPASHISHSRVIAPLGSPLPVLTRIQPYSSSFSRAHYGTQQTDSDSEETTAPSPSRSLWESSRYSPPSAGMSPRTPRTAELIQGSPRRTQMPLPSIAISPPRASVYEYLQDKKLASELPTGRNAGFADREVIRVSRPLHKPYGALDMQNYARHVPTQSVYMQSHARKDRHTRITRTTRRIPIQEDRTGLDISFDFTSGNDIMDSDSVGEGLNNDQQEITPGRPSVVLVPSGRRSDRSETPASASAPASVKPELEREPSGPRFASGLDPHFLLDSATQSSISRASSFHTAQEDFVEAEHPYCVREFGDEKRYTHNDAGGGSYAITRGGPPKLYLDLSGTPLAAIAGPGAQVSRSRGRPHHGQAGQRIGLGIDTSLERRAWSSTSSLPLKSSRDEYSRFATTTRTPRSDWSRFVSPSPTSGR